MASGYSIVDGDPARGVPPAQARGWLWALAAMVVAQWLLEFAAQPALWLASAQSGILGMVDGGVESTATYNLLWLIIPFGAVAAATLIYAARLHARPLASLGLTWRALPEGAVWILAGLAAATPIIAWFLMLPPGWLSAVGAAATLLTPATFIQAGAEEILFRGLILTALAARYGAGRGILISAVVFALWHIYPTQPLSDALVMGVTTFVFGVTAGILVLHQGHIGGAIALHVVWNVMSSLHAGTQNCCGLFPMTSDDFWLSYTMNAYAPWLWEQLVSPDFTITLALPLVMETAIVLIACRSTAHRLLGMAD